MASKITINLHDIMLKEIKAPNYNSVVILQGVINNHGQK